MRALPFLTAAVLVAGCSVKTNGALCHRDADCPTGQLCIGGTAEGYGHCEDTGAGSSTSGTGTSAGSGSSGSSSGTSSGSSGSTGCGSTVALGSGCGPVGSHGCGGNAELLSCEASDAGSCGVWTHFDDCTQHSLGCAAGATECTCPAVTNATYYVEQTAQAFPRTLARNGAQSPTDCSFKSIGEGLTYLAALDGGPAELRLTGASPVPASWQASTSYAANDLVTPTQPNGHYYQAQNAGSTGLIEPSWPTGSGATVSEGVGGNITWKEAGAVSVITFTNEPVPLTLPVNVSITGEGCATGGVCDPEQYVVLASSSLAAGQSAVVLTDGDGLRGMTFRNTTALAGDLVRCIADGGAPVQLRDLALQGKSSASGHPMDHGLVLAAHCPANVNGLVASGFSGAAITAALKDGAAATLAGLNLTQSDAGLEVVSGDVTASGVLSGNGVYGAFTNPAAGSDVVSLTLSQVVANSNGAAGVHLRGRDRDAGGDEVRYRLSNVETAANNPGDDPNEGGVVFEKSGLLDSAAHVFSHGNGFSQFTFTGDAYPSWSTPSGIWNLSHPEGSGSANDPDANRAYCYLTRSLTTYGVYSYAGLVPNVPVVNAQRMYWDHVPPSATLPNHDYGEQGSNTVAVGSYLGVVPDGGCFP